MEISWYIILNIFSIIIIRGCRGIKEIEYRNLINPNAESENYISVNISSHDAPNYFQIVTSELSGVDTVLLLPRHKVKIGELIDHNTSLWKRTEDQRFILGMISSSSHRDVFAINLIIKCNSGIKYSTYYYISDKYESVSISKYLDGFSLLKPIYSPENFTLNIAKPHIPEILDLTSRIGPYKVNLFIPHRKFRVTTVKFANNTIFDGTSDNRHVPILIGYEDHGKTYINMFVAQGDVDFGYIYKYKYQGPKFVFISKSERKAIFEIFTHQLGKLSLKTKPKDLGTDTAKVRSMKRYGFVDINSDKSTRADSLVDIEDIEIPRITVDIYNINTKFIRSETHKIMNMETIKYFPVGAIITSVTFDVKMLWAANDDEIKCLVISIHSVNGQKHAAELSILKKDGKIINRTMPYTSILKDDISKYEDEEEDGYTVPPSTPLIDLAQDDTSSIAGDNNGMEVVFVNDDNEDNRNREQDDQTEDKEQETTPLPIPNYKRPTTLNIKKPTPQYGGNLYKGRDREATPPNSPAKETGEKNAFVEFTPPNSPARTPPPSPARSPKNSISSDEPLSDIDLERIKSNMFKPVNNSQFQKQDDDISTSDEASPEKGSTFSVEPDHLDAVSNEEEYNKKYEREYLDREVTPPNSPARELEEQQDETEKEDTIIYNLFDEVYNEKKKKKKEKKRSKDIDDILDISSMRSINKMHVVDGTLLVPFVILYPRKEYPIRSIHDGEHCIWTNTNENQIIKYVSLYVKNREPLAMAIMIFDRPSVKYKYFLKDMYEWFEVSTHDYHKTTEYEFKKVEKENKQVEKIEEVKDENVLHVSIMIPVILGTIFLLLWVGSMLFIVFFL